MYSRTGVPKPSAVDQYRSEACWELGHTAGGEQWAGEASSVAPHRSSLLAVPPEPSPPLHTVDGKIVFRETGPWCKKGWGPLF